jgi:hypothetical protein
MVLDFTAGRFGELHRRFGNAIDGVFLTDDWGTQRGTFVQRETFEKFFARRYQQLFDAIHHHGWHVILHSCGRINKLAPRLIELGVNVLNMQQPQCYGLVEFGEQFCGKVCFLTTADIQSTLPRGNRQEVREEVRQLVRRWSTPDGGLIVFNYGDPEALAVTPETTRVMFDEFAKLADYWRDPPGEEGVGSTPRLPTLITSRTGYHFRMRRNATDYFLLRSLQDSPESKRLGIM